jgi:hypothetical protein
VAEDHRCELGCGRIQIKLGAIMQDPQHQGPNGDGLGHRQLARPGLRIDVAAHGIGRGNVAKLIEHLGTAHIAGVDDEMRSCQRGDGLGAQKAMGVRNHANIHGGLSRS